MKKLCLLFISIFMIGINSYSQDLIPNQNDKGKWGYVDGDGKVVIKHDYKEVSAFIDGRAKVRKGDNYGYINEENKTIIPLKYNTIDVYNNNIYKVSAGGNYKDGVLFNEKYGFIDYNGVEILKPEYNEIGLFTDGVAYVKKGDLYGYINDSIRVIIPCKFKAVGKFNKEGFVWVNEGGKFDKANSKKIVGGKFGIYNLHGDLIIPVKYASIGTFTLNGKYYRSHRILDKLEINQINFSEIEMPVNNDFYVSKETNGTKNGVINKYGEILVPIDKYFEVHGPEEGVAPVRTSNKNGNHYNYYDITTGTLMYKEGVTNTYSFEGGVAVQENDNKTYLVDKAGKCISSKYDILSKENDNIYRVAVKNEENNKCELDYITRCYINPIEENENLFFSPECGNSGIEFAPGYVHKIETKSNNDYSWGLINNDGIEVVPTKFNLIFNISEGVFAARECNKGKFGYINTQGKYIINPKYDDVYSFEYGYAYVKSENGWGIIDKTGVEIIPCKWNSIKLINIDNPQTLWVQKEYKGKWICLDLATGKPLFEKDFWGVRNFDNDFKGVAFVKDSNNKIGVIDLSGNCIIPMEIYDLDKAFKAYNILKESGKKKWEEIDIYRFKIYNNDKRNDFNLYNTIDDSLWDY